MVPSLIPTSGPELERAISDPNRVQAIANAGQLGALITAYARHVNETDPSIQEQAREQQQVLAQMLRENGIADGGRPNLAPAARRRGRVHGVAPDGARAGAVGGGPSARTGKPLASGRRPRDRGPLRRGPGAGVLLARLLADQAAGGVGGGCRGHGL